jgi:hypothetical protein
MLINIQNKRKNLALLLALFMIAAAYIRIPAVKAQTTPTLYIDPITYTATHRGEIVNLDINIRDLEENLSAIAVEFKLGFDPGIFKFVSIIEGPFMASFAGTPNGGTYFVHVAKTDHILAALVILPDENATWHAPLPNGDGTLATVSFEVIGGPAVIADFILYDTKLSDTTGVPPGVTHNTEDATFSFPVEYLAQHIIWDGFDFVVTTESNSTISDIDFTIGDSIAFNVTGETGSTGYMYLEMPREFMDGTFSVLINGIPTPFAIWQNATHTRLYFVYTHSTKSIMIFGTQVAPEFHSIALVLTPFIASIAMAVMKTRAGKYRRKQ